MKQGVMPCLAPRDLTTYLGFAGQSISCWSTRAGVGKEEI